MANNMQHITNKQQLDALVNGNISALANKDIQATVREHMQEKQTKSFITINSFHNYIEEGKMMEAPKELISHILVEHETTILFGDTGLGKSTLAMQIACEVAEQTCEVAEQTCEVAEQTCEVAEQNCKVAEETCEAIAKTNNSFGSACQASKKKRVLYVNFELSQQQWAKRFQNKAVPDNLFIANIDYSLMHDVTDQSHILDEIQRIAVENEIEVVIIDNLTNLCINSKEGGEAGNIMLQLISLRLTHNWTMLILAHVPKRKPCDPLSLNDLAGSKILSNLADNVIGLNKSKKDKSARYIIQLKYRSFPIELDYKNVQELRLTMSDDWLHFEYGDYDEERTHLPRSRDEKAELERDIVKELKEPNGLSYRAIAEKLDTSLGNVQRIAKSHGLNKKVEKSCIRSVSSIFDTK